MQHGWLRNSKLTHITGNMRTSLSSSKSYNKLSPGGQIIEVDGKSSTTTKSASTTTLKLREIEAISTSELEEKEFRERIVKRAWPTSD